MAKPATYPNPHDFGNWRAAPGVAVSPEWNDIMHRFGEDFRRGEERARYCAQTDHAWIVCLERAGIIRQAQAKRVLAALVQLRSGEIGGFGGETALIPALGGDEDAASLINLGRTLQEPISRLKIRAEILGAFDLALQLQATLLERIAEHADTLMPGHTHFSHAAPITLGAFLLAVHDEFVRGMRLLGHAYEDVNRSTGGCGSIAGIAWPVDRRLLAELLGFEGVSEPAYEGEASQDHSLTTLYALNNMLLVLSKASTNLEIWCMDDIEMMNLHPSWHGVSSHMPQKSHSGSVFEFVRMYAAGMIGELNNAISLAKGEFHGDVMAMLFICNRCLPQAVPYATAGIRTFDGILRNLGVDRQRMRQLVRDSYSCASEVVVHMVRNCGYGGRRAHRVVAHFVREARAQGLKPWQCTGAMLDAAALRVEDEPPRIEDATLRGILDPDAFLASHCHLGGVAPAETRRLHAERVAVLARNRELQAARRQAVARGDELLARETARICGT